MPNGHDLFASARLDASGVAEGVQQAKTALTTFNRALIENKSEMKSVSTELKQLEKTQSELAQKMKETNQPTEEQQAEMAKLSERIEALRMQAARLKTEEIDLKRKINGTTKELGEYYDKAKQAANATEIATKELDQYSDKAQQAADSTDTATKEMDQYSDKAQQAADSTDTATKEMGQYSDKAKQAADTTDTMAGKMQGLGAALKAVALGYTGKKLYDVLIGSNADMEQYLASFETALGSAEAAQRMVRNIAAFAAKTPLELPDVSEYTKLLMNYGYASDTVLDKLRQLGDLAEGNVSKLGSVTQAYGQMYAKGKVTGEELLQMTEAGVPLLSALAESMGKTAGEVQDMVSKGQVGIAELDAAIASLTTGTGRFAGAMEKQSTTMNGMLSTLQDNLAQMGRDAGQGVFQETKEAIREVNELLEEARKDGTVADIAETAGAALGGIIKNITRLLELGYDCKELIFATITAIGAYKTVVIAQTAATNAATMAQTAYNAALNANPVGLVIAALAGLATAYRAVTAETRQLIKSWEDQQETMETAIAEGRKEIAVIEHKAKIYEELRQKTNLTTEEKRELNMVAQELQETLGGAVQVINRETGAYNDLSASIAKFIETQDKAIRLEAMKESYMAALSGMEEADKKIRELQGSGSALQNAVIGAPKDYIHPIYQKQIDDLEKLKKSYQATIEEYRKLSVELNFMGVETEGATSASDKLTAAMTQQTTAAGELADALNAVESASKLYQSAVDEVKESQSLSLSTLQKIVEKYPEMEDVIYRYIGGLIKEQDVLNAMAGCYKADYNNYYSLIRAKLEADGTFYRNVLSANADRVNQFKSQYGIDLANYASYTAAKAAIDEQYYKAVNAAPDLGPGALTDIRNGNSLSSVRQSAAKARLKAQSELSAIFNSAFDGAGVNFEKLVKESVANSKGQTSQSGSSSGSSAELSMYEIANEAYKKLVNERIELIDAERDAKKEALDEAIAAIDAEIEARKRLTEDKSIEKEIQSLEAQLTYAKMDDFTRMELERELQKLREEQAETQWQRDMADKKAELQAGYDTADAELQAMAEELRKRLDYAGNLFDRLDGSPSASSVVNNNSTTANVQVINNALSAGQIAREIIRQLMDGVI